MCFSPVFFFFFFLLSSVVFLSLNAHKLLVAAVIIFIVRTQGGVMAGARLSASGLCLQLLSAV